MMARKDDEMSKCTCCTCELNGHRIIRFCPLHKAAPDLYEACRKAMTCALDSAVSDIVRAAIAKADGKDR